MLFPSQPDRSFSFPPFPVDLRFGAGIAADLGTLARSLGARRAFLVTDPGVVMAGLTPRLSEPLSASGVEVEVFDEVRQDSGSQLIMRGAAEARRFDADLVVGLGGGSALDSAKAIAAMATNGGSILDYVGLNKLPADPLPSICVPTTSGTGSEVSIWSVLTDDDTGMKVSAGGQRFMATVALCDPDLTLTLPPAVTAATGMDALAHASECYVNRACQPVSGALALQSIAFAGRSLRKAVHDGADRAARCDMMLASVLAGIAMNPTRLGLAHALAMPLGSWNLKIPHGTIIALTLPSVMAFNVEAAPERYAAVAQALGADTRGMPPLEAARLSVEMVARLKDDLGLPRGLGECGMNEDWVERIVAEAMKSGNVAVNPRETSPAQLAEVLRASI
ncbi:iron-containing alcohol dehydrogenase [Consotaella salsifontis]|uniref:Alcohol dehydrogenase 2 n=1 Tax=Consotaella salsifontis TaxID=1365950 RepID=A0A1T4TB17_9HYPH|nr:iron-containing alcohol dehydrogenase [Consotaella salsifontis]SKA37399.1 alcohol dehydrogenase [Consotaella salsifontis]